MPRSPHSAWRCGRAVLARRNLHAVPLPVQRGIQRVVRQFGGCNLRDQMKHARDEVAWAAIGRYVARNKLL